MTRDVVLLAHEVPTTADFPLEDLPGGAGRLDLLARAVVSSLLVSHGIREDTTAHLVVQKEYVVRFEGGSLRGLHPDERSTAAQIRAAIETAEGLIGAEERTHSPGVHVRGGGLASVLSAVDGPVVQLHEDGTPAGAVDPPADPTFVLSDHRDFADDEAALLAERAAHRLRLGPVALHADDAVAVAHHWLDTGGYGDF